MNQEMITKYVATTTVKLNLGGGFGQHCRTAFKRSPHPALELHLAEFRTPGLKEKDMTTQRDTLGLVAYLLASKVRHNPEAGNIGASIKAAGLKDQHFTRLLNSRNASQAASRIQHLAGMLKSVNMVTLVQDLINYNRDTRSRWAMGFTGGYDEQ